jgi:VanZ family protein
MKKPIRHFLWYRFPAIAWMTAIFVQSSISYLTVPDMGFSAQDKIAHGVEYAILGWLLTRALLVQRQARNAIWLAMVIACCYGVTDEIHQGFVPGRYADVGDIIADCVGAIFVAGIYSLRRKSPLINEAKK